MDTSGANRRMLLAADNLLYSTTICESNATVLAAGSSTAVAGMLNGLLRRVHSLHGDCRGAGR